MTVTLNRHTHAGFMYHYYTKTRCLDHAYYR